IESKARSFLSVPLHLSSALEGGMGRGRLVGVLNLTDRRGDEPFTESDLHLATAVGAQAAVAIENCLLVHKARQADKIHEQLEVAGRLQSSLLSGSDPVFEGLDVSGRTEGASSLAGDYYDFFVQGPGTLEAVVAESSAQGVSAALLMSGMRASVRTL